MADDPTDAQARRAAEIRERIKRLRTPDAEPEPPKSPRDFIEEKMREEDDS